MQSNNTIKNTLFVATLLCIVCSVMVSSAAVKLRPAQEKNKILEKKRNILAAAGLYTPGANVEELFKSFETKVVDLETGEYVEDIDIATYDQMQAAKDPEASIDIPSSADVASLKRRAKLATVYLYKKDGAVNQIIIPIRGPGLWSMLYGFLALDKDLNTVRGLGYYQHAETPGLGGEVDNPNWKGQWPGKKLYSEQGKIAVAVIKGKVDTSRPESIHQVDGLAGATITTRGVDNMLKYWLGEHGFGPYLQKIKSGS